MATSTAAVSTAPNGSLENQIDHGDTAKDSVILRGNFMLYPKFKTKCVVTCEPTKVSYYLSSSDTSTANSLQNTVAVYLVDVIGCDKLKGKTEGDPMAYIALYHYPHKKKIFSKKTVRKREVVTFGVNVYQTFEENCQIADKWKTVINCLLHGVLVSPHTDLSSLTVPKPKRLLVLVNPASGPGKALQIFQQRVVPLLAEAGIHFNMVVTERAGHAKNIVQHMKVDQFYGIVICSGDGLIHEVLNGIMTNENWEEAIKIPLGLLPGGSGNALSASINHVAGEPIRDDPALHASFVIAKHEVLPMDIVAVDTCSGKRLYSFLSVGWALVADVDIESEKFRYMGGARFTVGVINRVINLRKYRGRLSFKPTGDYKHQTTSTTSELKRQSLGGSQAQTDEQHFSRSKSCPENIQPQLIQVSDGSESNAQSGLENLEKIDEDVNADEVFLEAATDQSSSEQSADTSQNQDASVGHKPGEPYIVSTPDVPPLSEPVPSDWVVMEDDFISFVATYQKYLSYDMYTAPLCKLDDGCIHLGIIRGNATKTKLIKCLMDMETGDHVNHEVMETLTCTAFRLEPLTEKGLMTCDGELIEYGPIQGSILPSFATVMGISKCP